MAALFNLSPLSNYIGLLAGFAALLGFIWLYLGIGWCASAPATLIGSGLSASFASKLHLTLGRHTSIEKSWNKLKQLANLIGHSAFKVIAPLVGANKAVSYKLLPLNKPLLSYTLYHTVCLVESICQLLQFVQFSGLTACWRTESFIAKRLASLPSLNGSNPVY